jgi:hypothetical protein
MVEVRSSRAQVEVSSQSRHGTIKMHIILRGMFFATAQQ